jgi:hypothetical protein
MTQPADETEALLREVRLHVFGKAADTGRVPQPPEIAAALGRSQAEVGPTPSTREGRCLLPRK